MTLDEAVATAWKYLHRGVPPTKSDLIFVLGNEDIRCADRAAELWLGGFAPLLVMSGATGRSTRGVFRKTEAELFSDRARERGVPKEAILIEPRATNTGENVKFTRELLHAHGLAPEKILAVQKPYAERRVLVSLRKFWPGPEFSVTSMSPDFEAYARDFTDRDELVAMLAGEIHRMLEYPKRGWQDPEPVPDVAIEALRVLAGAGFTRHLVPGAPIPPIKPATGGI